MFPVLFSVGGFAVHTYGVASSAALLGGIGLAVWLGSRSIRPVAASYLWDGGLILIVSSIVGARAEYVRTHWQDFDKWTQAFDLRDGGLVFYGGLVLCTVSMAAYAWARGIPPLRFLDAFAIPTSLGHGLGRLGCFAAGCCYGRPYDGPFAVIFPPGSAAPAGISLHPAQLYAAALDVGVGIFLLWRRSNSRHDGEVTAAFLMYSAAVRLIVEHFRGDNERGIALLGLTNGQATSLVIWALGVALMVRVRRSR